MSSTNPAVIKDDSAAALELLADQEENRQQHLEAFPTQPVHQEEDEHNDSECTIMDIFMETGGEEAILNMTNFPHRDLIAYGVLCKIM